MRTCCSGSRPTGAAGYSGSWSASVASAARTALAVLSGLSVSDLFHAISTQDGVRLTRIPGIGKKTAERLLLELRDKLAAGAALPRQRRILLQQYGATP